MRSSENSACLPSFAELLKDFGRDELERHEYSVYGLQSNLTLGYLNPAWFRFAQQNGGHSIVDAWGLGSDVLEATTGPARRLYETLFRSCLERGRASRQDYECSSASQYRRFRMDVYPLREGRGAIVINSIRVDRPHSDDRVAQAPIEERYTDANGLILQCSFCRCVQRVKEPGHWDWVPAWVENEPENATGGLCHPCHEKYFNSPPEVR